MPLTETRKREIGAFKGYGRQRTGFTFDGGTTWYYFDGDMPFSLVGTETTTSQENPEWGLYRRLLSHPLSKEDMKRSSGVAQELSLRDVGGPFTSVKKSTWISHPWVEIFAETPGRRHSYRGPLIAANSGVHEYSSQWPISTLADYQEMVQLGTKAIALTLPTNPAANLATTLGELRNDGLPSIPTRAMTRAVLNRYRALGSVGSEFLNVVFGWQPLIADVRKLAHSVQESAKITEQFVRDSGRPIRRRLNFPTVRKTTHEVLQSGAVVTPWPALNPDLYASTAGTLTKTSETVTRTWFSACYTYYLDPGVTTMGRLRRNEQIAARLYGTRINPETLWELTPWSWAVDWVTNVGDVMTNISALLNDSLVIRWAYVMRETRVTDTYVITGPTFKSGHVGPFTQSFTTVTRQRIKATPYGFGLTDASFSTRQWAILAALGISRSGA